MISATEIAEKKIRLANKELTCSELRSGKPINIMGITKLDYGVAIRKMCSSILSIPFGDEAKVSYVDQIFKDALRHSNF
jgi:hypothetical protein